MGSEHRTVLLAAFILLAVSNVLASELPSRVAAATRLPSVQADVYFTGQVEAGPLGFERSNAGELWFLETPEIGTGFLTRLLPDVPGDSSFQVDPAQVNVAPDTYSATPPSVTRVTPRRSTQASVTFPVTGDSGGAFVRYQLPTADAWACDLEAHDFLFFTERNPSKIGRFDPSSSLADEWDVPTRDGFPVGLLAFGDTVYFVEAWSCLLGRLVTTAGQFTEWTIPNATPDWTGYPGLDRDNTGHLWLTNSRNGNMLVEVEIGAGDTAAFNEWTVPGSPFSGPMDVMADDGRLWYTIEAQDENGDTSKVGVLDPVRQEYREWRLPDEGAAPYYLELGADGAVWIGENGGAAVTRLSPSENEFTTYPVNISQGYIYDYTLDGKGNLWVACYDDHALVKLSGVATGVSERPGLRPASDRLAVWPNPFSSRVHCPPRLECSVFDRGGRLVAEVRNGVWDGSGLDGRQVGAGVYIITAGAGEPVAVVKLR